jgi:hypothetical protein
VAARLQGYASQVKTGLSCQSQTNAELNRLQDM